MEPINKSTPFNHSTFDLYNEAFLNQELKKLGFSLQQPKALAQAILELSDLYNSKKGSSHIWSYPHFCAAYWAYFLPLNYMRCLYALKKSSALFLSPSSSAQAPSSLDTFAQTFFIDYGAGSGAMSWALLKILPKAHVIAFEPSAEALKIYQSIFKKLFVREPLYATHNTKDLFQFLEKKKASNKHLNIIFAYSYSLNEFEGLKSQFGGLSADSSQTHPLEANDPWTSSALFVEPSLQWTSRHLQALRQKFIDKDYQVIAPCLHQKSCPLLEKTKNDWCHTRFRIVMPSWFRSIEHHLPMKNDSLTLSYLAVSRDAQATIFQKSMLGNLHFHSRHFRVIGDTLFEKGKVKQAVCRGPEREFLTWLTRDGEPPQLPRGEIVKVDSCLEPKGQELRCLYPFQFNVL